MTAGADALREEVRKRYAKAAQRVEEGSGCGCGSTCCTEGSHEDGCCGDECCGGGAPNDFGQALYSTDERAELPETAARASLGCGTPAAVAELKEGEGGPILVAGSGTLGRTLIEHDLVDEYRLMVFPVVLGSGRRLFPDSPDKRTLELVETTQFPTGVVAHHYRPAA